MLKIIKLTNPSAEICGDFQSGKIMIKTNNPITCVLLCLEAILLANDVVNIR